MRFVLIFFLLLPTRASELDLPVSIKTDMNFLMFQRGNNKQLMDDGAAENVKKRNPFEGSRLNPTENFQIKVGFENQSIRAMARSYLRMIYNHEFYTATLDQHPTFETVRPIYPVLHFEDGDKNHYLLKRINDEVFDLILLRASKTNKAFSAKKVENYPIEDYVEIARLSQNRELKISIYEEDSSQIPQITSREIPLEPLDIGSLLEEKEKARQKFLDRIAVKKEAETVQALSAEEKGLLRFQEFKTKLQKLLTKQDEELEKRKRLIRMRLPKLDMSDTRTMRELGILVQSAIIFKVFNPHPISENCPGTIENNRCLPNGEWDEKTWKLYRKLYRITDVAGLIYDGEM